jgi:hypothetical protein
VPRRPNWAPCCGLLKVGATSAGFCEFFGWSFSDIFFRIMFIVQELGIHRVFCWIGECDDIDIHRWFEGPSFRWCQAVFGWFASKIWSWGTFT